MEKKNNVIWIFLQKILNNYYALPIPVLSELK